MFANGPLQVLVVVPHEALRTAISLMVNGQPDLRLVGACSAIADAEGVLASTSVDVVLLDATAVWQDERAMCSRLRAVTPQVRVLALTDPEPVARRDDDEGAADVHLAKQASSETLLEALRAAGALCGRRRAVPPDSPESLGDRLAAMSPTDREVLRMLVLGYGSNDIGHRLGMARRQVDVRRSALMGTLRVGSRAQLARLLAPPAPAGPPMREPTPH